MTDEVKSSKAAAKLRQVKSRPTKPFAVMVRDIDVARRYAMIDSAIEAQLLTPAAPIVLSPLLLSSPGSPVDITSSLAPSVLSGLGMLGIMLPYSPLHHLLLASFDKPLIMTSGNHGGAPQVTSNCAARTELDGIVDGWLLHNRKTELTIA